MTKTARMLRERRKALGISEKRLAERAGLSVTAVRQALADPGRSLTKNVSAVAHALGLELVAEQTKTDYQVRRQAALAKARRLVALMHGNSALERQAVDEQTAEDLIEQTANELMAGPPLHLWN